MQKADGAIPLPGATALWGPSHLASYTATMISTTLSIFPALTCGLTLAETCHSSSFCPYLLPLLWIFWCLWHKSL